jgi:hypothetical protein
MNEMGLLLDQISDKHKSLEYAIGSKNYFVRWMNIHNYISNDVNEY